MSTTLPPASSTTDAVVAAPVYQSLDYLSPQGLQTSAWLYGVHTPPPANARILELGCGDGANLRPFALANPQANAVGIDLDAGDIAPGEHWLTQHLLPNLQLAVMDLPTLLSSELGAFDYIVVRGVFSLVSGEGRAALLAFCQRHLSPEGVACFGYNTYPGWKSAEVLQDAMQMHLSLVDSPEAQNASARGMLVFMAMGMADNNPQRPALQEFIREAKQFSDVDLALNYYQGLNQPCYLMDFLTLASEAGFAWLGDAQPYTELAEHYSDNVVQLHQTICPYDHKLMKQQYLDFAVGRKHRYTLLVSTARAGDIRSLPDLERLADFHWAGNYRRHVVEGKTDNLHLLGDGRSLFSSDDELAHDILDVIGDAWPNSVSVEQIVFNTCAEDGAVAEHKKTVLTSLGYLYSKGVLGLHTRLEKSRYNAQSAPVLTLLPGVMTDYRLGCAAETACQFVNFWHEHHRLPLDEAQSACLSLMVQGGTPASAEYYPLMAQLRDCGLVWGGALAWRSYLQQAIIALPQERALEDITALLFYSTKREEGGVLSAREVASLAVKGKKSNIMAPVPKTVSAQIRACIERGAFLEARDLAQELVDSQPRNAYNWNALVNVCVDTKDREGALAALLQTLSLNPLYWDTYEVLATVQYHLGRYFYSGRLIRKVLRAYPKHRISWQLLSTLHGNRRKFKLAENCARKALELAPDHQGALCNLGNFLDGQGRQAEALGYFQKVVDMNPEEVGMHSNLLFTSLHVPSLTPDEVYRAHRYFGEVVEKMADRAALNLPLTNSKYPTRPLRIGFVSADLRDHPVTNFIEPVWQHIDRNSFSLHVYSNSERYDAKSKELEALSASWDKVCNISDMELARKINHDKIDILIDLSGHTAGNRLAMFAMKPAPLQMSSIGYPGTTGLAAIDYHTFNDDNEADGILDDQFTEKLIFLPFFHMFEPIANCPPVNPLPALSNGYLTFGSFNRLNKMNTGVYALWSQILVALPSARMLIGAMDGDDEIAIIRETMEQHGVNPEQLIFRNRTHIQKYLQTHHEVDILLDTFPYSGGTTTQHAGWMGVPTLTLAGQTMASLQGVSVVKSWGLDAFIATSPEDFVQKAIVWQHDLETLSEIRASMRSRFTGKKPTRIITPATYFEEMLRTAWRRYCEGLPAQRFSVKE